MLPGVAGSEVWSALVKEIWIVEYRVYLVQRGEPLCVVLCGAISPRNTKPSSERNGSLANWKIDDGPDQVI
jgi:hypothetical protein